MKTKDTFGDFQADDLIYHPQVLEIVKSGNEFCQLAEKAKTYDKKNFIEELLKILSKLYAFSVSLELPDDLAPESTQTFVKEGDWVYIEESLKEELGSDNRLAQLREPEHPEETTEIELSECLADSYQTVKDFVLLYELAYEKAARAGIAVYKQLFDYHTGPRVLLIMSELHDIYWGPEAITDDKSFSEQTQQTDKSELSEDRWINHFFKEDEKS